VVFYDQVYRSEDAGSTFQPVAGTRDLPPPFPGPAPAVAGPGDTIFFGEYTAQPRPLAPRIVRGTDDGRRWEVVYQFPPGEIFHIHSIAYDPYRQRYWVATGDHDDEVQLLFTEDGFRSLEMAGCCEQRWRMVDPIITEEALYWGSDDDRVNPGIFRFDPNAGPPRRLADLPNPSYSAALLEDGSMVVATTYEPKTPWTMSAPAPPRVSLFFSPDGEEWTEILGLPASAEAVQRSLRPQLLLPTGDPLPFLVAGPLHTAEHHFTLLVVDPRKPSVREANTPSEGPPDRN
jgi:hypothetical protein